MESLTFVPTSSSISSSYSSDVAKQVRFYQWRQSSLSTKCAVNATQPLVYTARANLRDCAVLKVSCCRNSDARVLEARCMDEVYDSLAERLLPTAAAAANPNFKYIVGLAGPPGAGKSTVASEVVKRINNKWPQKAPAMDELIDSPEVATVLPMDGFHLYRHQLDAMEDPKEAHARRGAPWTFDPARLLKCLQTLKNEGSVCAPSFDHGVGDPVEDDIFVSLQHKVVIVEGNYLLLEEGVWNDISTLFDEKWFIDVDLDTSMQRVLKRHMSKSNRSPEEAKWRIDYNDRPNAELIMKSKKNADLIVKSIDLEA
ncbi:putative uridine kinase C227.14 [Silene latifolia]|uniref:putative uridine kinase C227.14 n=1 Tax=Silene latifolia TaxID=37657 RepID=UPI003D787137